jgi:hypothetical protein
VWVPSDSTFDLTFADLRSTVPWADMTGKPHKAAETITKSTTEKLLFSKIQALL